MNIKEMNIEEMKTQKLMDLNQELYDILFNCGVLDKYNLCLYNETEIELEKRSNI